MKTIENSFRDWDGNTFGYGYGSGEEHTIPALRRFLELCDGRGNADSTQYDYEALEKALTPIVTWLLINTLAHADILEYGTSPRFAWLTSKGERLKAFMLSHTIEELVEMATDREEGSDVCYPDACNCGPNGYQKGVQCKNPFWTKDY